MVIRGSNGMKGGIGWEWTGLHWIGLDRYWLDRFINSHTNLLTPPYHLGKPHDMYIT